MVFVHHPHFFGEVELVGRQVVVVDKGDVELALLGRVVGGPLVAQRLEEFLVARQVSREQAQAAQQSNDAGIALRPAVECGELAAQHIHQERLVLVVVAPSREVEARDEGPALTLEVVDEAVLNVAFLGDAGHRRSR